MGERRQGESGGEEVWKVEGREEGEIHKFIPGKKKKVLGVRLERREREERKE